MEDKEKIDAGFSAMLEKEQAELDQAVKEYFGKHWPDLSTEEGRNTPMTFTPFAVMRLARHFYELGRMKHHEKRIKANHNLAYGILSLLESPRPVDWYMDESGREHCWGYQFDEPCPWPAEVYITKTKKEDKK